MKSRLAVPCSSFAYNMVLLHSRRILLSHSLLSIRKYTLTNLTVPLSYTKYSPTKNPTDEPCPSPLVICHGLFGSKQNWKALAKAMSRRLSRDVYALVRKERGKNNANCVFTTRIYGIMEKVHTVYHIPMKCSPKTSIVGSLNKNLNDLFFLGIQCK